MRRSILSLILLTSIFASVANAQVSLLPNAADDSAKASQATVQSVYYRRPWRAYRRWAYRPYYYGYARPYRYGAYYRPYYRYGYMPY